MAARKDWEGIFSGLVMLADLLCAWFSVRLGWWVWFNLISVSVANRPSEQFLKTAVVAVLWAALILGGSYRRIFKRNIADQLIEIYKTSLYSLLIMAIWVFATKGYKFSRGFIVLYFLTAPAILSLVRLAFYWLKLRLLRSGWGVKNALIIGNSQAARDIIDYLVMHHAYGYRIVGILAAESKDLKFVYRGIRAIGLSGEYARVIEQYGVRQVFIPDLSGGLADHSQLITLCQRLNTEVRVVSHQADLLARIAGIYDMAGISLLEKRSRLLDRTYTLLKRLTDILASGIGMAACAPLFAAVAAVIRLDSPGPVFFKQERVRKGGGAFQLYKFRTMFQGADSIKNELADQNDADGPLFKTRKDPRITRTGRWLRRLSLDELPQLFNVFKGEMSLVGPRPPLPSEVQHYQAWHKYRLNGPQGMTGLWQVSGRSELSFEEMVLLDIYYLEHWSPLMDLEILIKTIPAVITAKGAY